MRIRFIAVLLASLLCCSGCIRIEEMMTLQSDGSGKVQVELTFPQLGMRWLPGKPAEDWLEPNLPKGVELLSFTNRQQKGVLTDDNGKDHELVNEVYSVGVSFDHVKSLNQIRVRPDDRNETAANAGGAPGRAQGSMFAKTTAEQDTGPFQSVSLTDKGDRLHFRRVVQAARDPDEAVPLMMNTPGGNSAAQAFDLRDSALVISIQCPGDIIEHNADQVEGRKLTWTFNLQEMQDTQDRDWVAEFTCLKETK